MDIKTVATRTFLAGTLALGIISPASAYQSRTQADDITVTSQYPEPITSDALTPTSIDIEVPENLTDGVTMRAPSVDEPIEIRPDMEADSASSTTDETIYHGQGVDQIIREQLDGVQLLSTHDSYESPDVVDYHIDIPSNAELVSTDEAKKRGFDDVALAGRDFLIIRQDGVLIGWIEKPWAIDAAGQSVATSYSYSDGVLSQFVDHRQEGVQYPVIADPKIGLGLGLYLYLNKMETQVILGASSVVSALGANWACTQYGTKLAKFPGMSNLVNYLCKFVTGKQLYDFFVNLPSVLRSLPPCSELRFTGSWEAKSVREGLCQPINKSWMWD